ncbi:hypothetical protein V1477_010786 [Vespula maculifrons]|uniref:Secreted protein n=1 Tax=Vespula maculifrons TaxID=7453 RepID=A0ABD2C2X7_VESMC
MLLSSAKYLTLLVLSTVPFPDSTYGMRMLRPTERVVISLGTFAGVRFVPRLLESLSPSANWFWPRNWTKRTTPVGCFSRRSRRRRRRSVKRASAVDPGSNEKVRCPREIYFLDPFSQSLPEAAGSSSKRTTSPLLTPDNSTDLTALRSPLLVFRSYSPDSDVSSVSTRKHLLLRSKTVNSVNVSQRCTMQHHDGYLRVTDRDRIGFRNATRGVIATGHKNVTPKRTAE